jgi:hypothetical protein
VSEPVSLLARKTPKNVFNNQIGPVFGSFKGRLHGAFSMCVSMSDKPFDAEACDIGGQASATNGGCQTVKNTECTMYIIRETILQTHIKNALCNRPLRSKRGSVQNDRFFYAITRNTWCHELLAYLFLIYMLVDRTDWDGLSKANPIFWSHLAFKTPISSLVIGCVTAMKMRLRTLLHSRRSQADAVGSYAKSMKGVTCDTSAS